MATQTMYTAGQQVENGEESAREKEKRRCGLQKSISSRLVIGVSVITQSLVIVHLSLLDQRITKRYTACSI